MNPTAYFVAVAARRGMADVALVESALAFACIAHFGQERKSRDPFITHPIAVAQIVAGFDAATETIAAALLHDILIETKITVSELDAHFGSSVAELLSQYRRITQANSNCEDHLESCDRRLAQLKTADRLHNMRTIEFVEKDKRRLKAHQSLRLIAPLARRHGLGDAAEELSALSSSVFRAGPGVSAPVAAPNSRCPSEADQATSRLIRAAASILPRSQRDDWIAEWEGELGAIHDQEGRQRLVRNVLLKAAPVMALRRAPYRSSRGGEDR